jgi:DNA (cytosine-5)-methyltransferase 1
MAQPIIPLVGRKSRLLKQIDDLLPDMTQVKRYFEPFFGSGAVAMYLQEKGYQFEQSVYNDANYALMQLYASLLKGSERIWRAYSSVQEEMLRYRTAGDKGKAKEFYLNVRDRSAMYPETRTLFLLRNGFNGLWRVNKKGSHNVPWGDKNGYLSKESFDEFVRFLQVPNTILMANDACSLFYAAQPGDFFYLDPPYTGIGGFTQYTAEGWTEEDDRRLREAADVAVSKGAQVMVSAPDTDHIRQVWDGWQMHAVSTSGTVAAKKGDRGVQQELIFTSYVTQERRWRGMSLCSGIGGLDLAATLSGIDPVVLCEIDPFCQKVLTKHWPEVPLVADLKKFQGDQHGKIDILYGGIPCTPFSTVGTKKGKADDRYLWPDAFRVVQEARPTWVVIENVADFLKMAFDDVAADLEREGYTVRAYVLPACSVQAVHQRNRAIIVAYCKSLEYANGTRRDSRQSSSGDVSSRNNHTLQTIVSSSSGGGASVAQCRLDRVLDESPNWMDGRFLTPAFQGEPQHAWEPPRIVEKSQVKKNHNKRLKAIGNGVFVPLFMEIFQAIRQADRG